jgi:BMFP domain-containing protein YqiC
MRKSAQTRKLPSGRDLKANPHIMNTLTKISFTLVLTTLVGCEDRKVVVIEEKPAGQPVAQTKTLETAALKSAIDSYTAYPTAENAAHVRKAFAELDGEIAELEAKVTRETGEDRAEAAQKLANLTAYREAEKARFAQTPASGPGVVPADGRSGAQKIEDAARKSADSLKDAAKDAADGVGDAIRDAAR